MFTYQQLDAVADAYIPALLLIIIMFLIRDMFKLGGKQSLIQLVSVITLIGIVYLVMGVDNYFKIWPAFGLDYSTHTALSLALVVCLCTKGKLFMSVFLLSFVAYVALMIYQQYHTIEDIVSTALVLWPMFWIVRKQLFVPIEASQQTLSS